MSENNSGSVQVFDFNWVIKYLGINNKEIVKQYHVWNHEQLMENYKDKKQSIPNLPFKVYANKKFRGSAAGHYIPSQNIVEIKEEIDEKNPSYWQKTMIAHEFAHALIGDEKIIGNRRGHGVLFYQCLMRDVVWFATNLTLGEKLQAMQDEFSYSCSLGQYRGTNRIFRSQSCTISLDLAWFSIKELFQDKRSDINNLGQWLWDQISEHTANLENKEKLLELPIIKLIEMAKKHVGYKKIEISEEQQIKMLRR